MEKKFKWNYKEYDTHEEMVQAQRDHFLEGDSKQAYEWRKELPKEIALDPGYDPQTQKYNDNMRARAAKRKGLMEANIKKYLADTRAISGCVFCKIFIDKTYDELLPNGIMRINPLNPVVNDQNAPHSWLIGRFNNDNSNKAPSVIREEYGHTMFVPIEHAEDASDNPRSASQAFYAAAEYVDQMGIQANIITSVGTAATQSVFHTHIHVVPRDHEDTLMLPWSFQDSPETTEWGSSFVRFKQFDNVNEAPIEIAKHFSKGYRMLQRMGVYTDYESLH